MKYQATLRKSVVFNKQQQKNTKHFKEINDVQWKTYNHMEIDDFRW